MIFFLLYVLVSVQFAYTIMTNLENLRNTIVKNDIKSRKKLADKVKEAEKRLNMIFLWPVLLVQQAIYEYKSRK